MVQDKGYLSTIEAARLHNNSSRQYIVSEIARGSLPALKVNGRFVILTDSFNLWHGSKRKRDKPTSQPKRNPNNG